MRRSILKMTGFVVVVTGCQSTPKTSKTPVAVETCEDQLAELSEVENNVSVIEKSKQAGGYVVSYGATAAGYTADALVYVVEGVVKTVVYCPAFLASVATGAVTPHYCSPLSSKEKIRGSNLGKRVYTNTSGLRKADYTPLSQAIRKTSRCFESRGDEASLAKAKGQLEALQNSDLFKELSSDEQKEVQVALGRLKARPVP